MYGGRTTSKLDLELENEHNLFLPAAVCMFLLLNNSETFLQRSALRKRYSPLTCSLVRSCSGLVRERSCLLWKLSENRGIPDSTPTLRQEPLHRCSPKVNESLLFCGSSEFFQMKFYAGLSIRRVLISPVFCWFISPVWFRKWQTDNSVFPTTELCSLCFVQFHRNDKTIKLLLSITANLLVHCSYCYHKNYGK